jgi:hypothetical protein
MLQVMLWSWHLGSSSSCQSSFNCFTYLTGGVLKEYLLLDTFLINLGLCM